MTAIGVDIGGTKTIAALVENGTVRDRSAGPTPAGSGPDAVLAHAAGLVGDLGARADVPVGVGTAGTIDPGTGVVRYATDSLPGWAGTPVAAELRHRTGRRVSVDNDVNAAALGEARHGAGREHGRVLLAAVGTGVGGGLVVGGRVCRGPRGTATELAHLYVGETADPCGCGRHGHLEAVASGTGIAHAYARSSGEHVPAHEIARRADAGEAAAAGVLAHAADVLGRTLAGCVAVLDVDVVVLAGGVTPSVLEAATESYRHELLDPHADVALVPARLGGDAVAVGAADLTEEET
ncbi:glucokinase [Haloactinopolyspora alba]|uniref:Glucokinase n=1 Tax=Haloactinopolyspora alba TaxID=648780 RepID=A0A2P8DT71_9ACTN|nr:ROK family protein [Haloactinopolyspora alba]PSL00412.1 glucokinase [Haloactinopolyspora alba]